MSVTPVPGTTRYLCPLECGWHHDVPPVSTEWLAELGATIGPDALDANDMIGSFVRQAFLAEARQTDAAVRQHLATHTTEQFARVIHDLRVEVAELRERPVRSEGTDQMGSRRALMDALWDNYTVAYKNGLIDAFAHELAEEIRNDPYLGDEYASLLAADFIDPAKSASPVRPGEETT